MGGGQPEKKTVRREKIWKTNEKKKWKLSSYIFNLELLFLTADATFLNPFYFLNSSSLFVYSSTSVETHLIHFVCYFFFLVHTCIEKKTACFFFLLSFFPSFSFFPLFQLSPFTKIVPTSIYRELRCFHKTWFILSVRVHPPPSEPWRGKECLPSEIFLLSCRSGGKRVKENETSSFFSKIILDFVRHTSNVSNSRQEEIEVLLFFVLFCLILFLFFVWWCDLFFLCWFPPFCLRTVKIMRAKKKKKTKKDFFWNCPRGWWIFFIFFQVHKTHSNACFDHQKEYLVVVFCDFRKWENNFPLVSKIDRST